MLRITRRPGEAVRIGKLKLRHTISDRYGPMMAVNIPGQEEVLIRVEGWNGGQLKIKIVAPSHIKILRDELPENE